MSPKQRLGNNPLGGPKPEKPDEATAKGKSSAVDQAVDDLIGRYGGQGGAAASEKAKPKKAAGKKSKPKKKKAEPKSKGAAKEPKPKKKKAAGPENQPQAKGAKNKATPKSPSKPKKQGKPEAESAQNQAQKGENDTAAQTGLKAPADDAPAAEQASMEVPTQMPGPAGGDAVDLHELGLAFRAVLEAYGLTAAMSIEKTDVKPASRDYLVMALEAFSSLLTPDEGDPQKTPGLDVELAPDAPGRCCLRLYAPLRRFREKPALLGKKSKPFEELKSRMRLEGGALWLLLAGEIELRLIF